MSIKELWIRESEYVKKYQEKYPRYQMKIKDYIVLYENNGDIYYSIEDAYLEKNSKEV